MSVAASLLFSSSRVRCSSAASLPFADPSPEPWGRACPGLPWRGLTPAAAAEAEVLAFAARSVARRFFSFLIMLRVCKAREYSHGFPHAKRYRATDC